MCAAPAAEFQAAEETKCGSVWYKQDTDEWKKVITKLGETRRCKLTSKEHVHFLKIGKTGKPLLFGTCFDQKTFLCRLANQRQHITIPLSRVQSPILQSAQVMLRVWIGPSGLWGPSQPMTAVTAVGTGCNGIGYWLQTCMHTRHSRQVAYSVLT
jgi:hypothetical protein